MEKKMEKGIIFGISGPVVTASNMFGSFMFELVKVGTLNLVGEIIQLKGDMAVIQVYEDTSGVAVGDPVTKTGEFLSVELGPGIADSIFDGVQRPLTVIAERSGTYIPRGINMHSLNHEKKWSFDLNDTNFGPGKHYERTTGADIDENAEPEAIPTSGSVSQKSKKEYVTKSATGAFKEGDIILEGDIYGTVVENENVNHRIMAPPGTMGRILYIAEPGEYTLEDPIVTVELDDANGHTTKRDLKLSYMWPVRTPKRVRSKVAGTVPLLTGQRSLDGLFPLAHGATCAVPGAFGVGKTVVSQALSKYSNSDFVVYTACGERGNECAELIGSEMTETMKKTCLIANTSNMPVAAREASIYSGVTVCEHFRDMGYKVAMMADSTSRWAEALREISGRLQELPGEGGYPSYLAARLASFYERAGRATCLGKPERDGSITIVGAVSPAGGDFSDAVCVATLNIVQTFWGLSKALAKRKHFPSVDWNISYSRCTDSLRQFYSENPSTKDFVSVRSEARKVLQKENELLETVQLVGQDSLGEEEKLILDVARIIKEGFLQQNAFTSHDRYCPIEKTAAMLRNIMHYYRLASKTLETAAAAEKGRGKQAVYYNDLKVQLQELITRIERQKFVDSNKIGVKPCIDILDKLHEDITISFQRFE